jgi:hypothetical protein
MGRHAGAEGKQGRQHRASKRKSFPSSPPVRHYAYLDTEAETPVPPPRLCYDPVSIPFIWLAVHDARKTLIALEFKGIWPICLVCMLELRQ